MCGSGHSFSIKEYSEGTLRISSCQLRCCAFSMLCSSQFSCEGLQDALPWQQCAAAVPQQTLAASSGQFQATTHFLL
jgi:hypothetical protein